ncbi:MAG: hypothetical protein KDA71_06145 [Planctomycetales bacterium]|nr:hypothetical protein [Planctomycetales bacterium]
MTVQFMNSCRSMTAVESFDSRLPSRFTLEPRFTSQAGVPYLPSYLED